MKYDYYFTSHHIQFNKLSKSFRVGFFLPAYDDDDAKSNKKKRQLNLRKFYQGLIFVDNLHFFSANRIEMKLFYLHRLHQIFLYLRS